MYLCILDEAGTVLLHRNLRAKPDAFLKAVAPYREDLDHDTECVRDTNTETQTPGTPALDSTPTSAPNIRRCAQRVFCPFPEPAAN
jgi:hypothetical protein